MKASWIFSPSGRLGGKVHRVYLLQVRNAEGKSCAGYGPPRAFGSTYDEPQGRLIKIGGMEALRLTAQARCANALPKAVVICMRQGNEAYLAQGQPTRLRQQRQPEFRHRSAGRA